MPQTESNDVAIVIPVFNQAAYTRSCLDGLVSNGFPENKIVVVDNASTDDTAAFLSSRPALRVVRNPSNRGCGAAWNQGARALPATWTVLLNNDVLLPQGWLMGLVQFAEEENFDVVSPAMCNGANDYDLASHARELTARMATVRRTGVASGVCFMVHRRVFEAAGYFDDDPLLGGYEDDEFFRRCRQSGLRLAITGRSFLHHFGSVTQKAIKAGMNKPRASLGDRDHYRNKYGLTWLKRHRERLRNQIQNFWWRNSELLRHGQTLVADRQNGQFTWR